MKNHLYISSLFLSLSVMMPVFAEDADKYAPVRDQLQQCVTCHGDKGASDNPKYPILAGQHLYYNFRQLRDFKSGRREDPVMTPMAQQLERDEMMLIAEYFSEQEWPDICHKASPEEIAIAKRISNSGQCVQCHLGGYKGSSGTPRLGGQHVEYLSKTMLDYKHGRRGNSPAMTANLLEDFEDEELKAMASYLAGLKGND
ncbi:MAG: c-type cytochrome [Gammaproteobacteria bacterium]|nr:c-type cytochrome [Gammaproteobacteria bacterium]